MWRPGRSWPCRGWRLTCCGPPGSGGSATSARGCPSRWSRHPIETAADPADKVTLADEVGYALLVVMETLSPAERTAFVLHDLFGVSVR